MGMGRRKKNGKTLLTPQQEQFLKNYLDPQSDTWSNAYQSALKAGFEEEYAQTILNKDSKWLNESFQESDILAQAIQNLADFVSKEKVKGIKWDATKFALSTLGKKRFSTKGEDATATLAENITGMRIIKENADRIPHKE